MLKEKRSKGNREARSKLMEKRERQKETQKMYRMRKREKKAAASNVESPAAVDAIESPPAAAATTQNESTSQSGISTPHSVSFSSPQLSTSTPKVVPSTFKPGPSGVRRKRDRKTYMSSYKQNLSRQKKSAIKSRDRQKIDRI